MANRTFLSLILLSALIFLAYSNSFDAPFQMDDIQRIVRAEEIRTLNPASIFNFSKSRFLTYLSFAFNYSICEQDVFGYHAVNFLIHLGSAIVVFFLVRALLPNTRCLIPFFVSALFALHPIQTESVTYIWQRSESLMGFFYLSTLLLYAHFRRAHQNAKIPKNTYLIYAAFLICSVLAYLSKPSSITLPLAVILIEVIFIKQGREDFKKHAPFIFPLFALAIIPILLANTDPHEALSANTFHSLGNVSIRLTPEYLPYYYTKLRVLLYALGLIIIPYPLRLEYDFTWSSSLFNPPSTVISLFVLSAIITAGLIFRRKNPTFCFAVLWFFITLIPTSLLFLGDLFFEHYLYLAIFGWALLITTIISSECSKHEINKKLWAALLGTILVVYCWSTYQRNEVWRSEVALWEDAVKKSPNKARARFNLGYYYMKNWRLEDAFEQFKIALKLKPFLPEGHLQLGEYYIRKNELALALSSYNTAALLKPSLFDAQLRLGVLYFDLKRYDVSETHLRKALKTAKDQYDRNRIKTTIKTLKRREPGKISITSEEMRKVLGP